MTEVKDLYTNSIAFALATFPFISKTALFHLIDDSATRKGFQLIHYIVST